MCQCGSLCSDISVRVKYREGFKSVKKNGEAKVRAEKTWFVIATVVGKEQN